MNCETCPTKNFVHADLYCRGCKRKPEISGTAYLYRKNKLLPLLSETVKAPENQVILAAAHKLMKEFRIEFIGDE